MTKREQIGVCFFGITRSLRFTISSIEQNVLGPLRDFGDPVIICHFFEQDWINNPRSGEVGKLDHSEHELLGPDVLFLEEPDRCLERWSMTELRKFGDNWSDGFASLRNLVHQLHSLNTVTETALEKGIRICLFIRPDLEYHDSISSTLRYVLAENETQVLLPYWQSWGGYNDRFAICSGTDAIRSYGTRVRSMMNYCFSTGRSLNSEALLKHVLTRDHLQVKRIGLRASRVRLDGTRRQEDFSGPYVRRAKDLLSPLIAAVRANPVLFRATGPLRDAISRRS